MRGADKPADAAAAKGWARPLRVHLSAVILLLLVCISLPLMWLTYKQGTRSAEIAGTKQMRLLSRHAIDRYRSIFGDGLSAITMASVSDAFLTDPPADLGAKTDFLIGALSSSPYIDGIYVGYPSGAFVQAVSFETNPAWKAALPAPDGAVFAVRTIEIFPDGRISRWRFLGSDGGSLGERSSTDFQYDPRDRPWYKAASKQPEPVAVGPYVTATTRNLALTLARHLERRKGIIVGTDVLLETISRLLASEAVSPSARGYVFDDQNRLIVHSDPLIMERVLETLSSNSHAGHDDWSDPVLDALRGQLGAFSDEDEAGARFNVAGQPYLAEGGTTAFSDMLKANTLVIAAPLADFTTDSERLLRKALLIAGMILILGMLAALMIARLVTTSLSALTADAREIGDMEFSRPVPIRSHITEINTLAGAVATAREAIKTFAYYMPRELVRKIVASGQAAAGAAVRQEVTVLFTDIRDFTTISEGHSPEDVVALLSKYFQLLNETVERHNGVIVQYLGDSIYAIWNAPIADPDHVRNACACVLAMKAAVDAQNAGNRAAGLRELVTRYGLHTGIAVVGSVGALTRRQYTAMGDTVNVASRLEGINKGYRTSILVSDAVRLRCGGGFAFRPLGSTKAKGRAEEIEIFELVGVEADSLPSGNGEQPDPASLQT